MKPRFPSRRKWSENGALAAAATAFAEDPSPEHRQALFDALRRGPLLVALRDLPRSPTSRGEMTVQFSRSDHPEDGPALCVFSGPEAAAARAPAGLWLAVESIPILTWIFSEELGGIVIDPEGAAVRLAREQVGRILGLVPPRPVGLLSRSAEPENRVHEALTRLLERSDRAGHVVVREPRTGKSVLFDRTDDGALLMLVRAASLARDEVTRTRMMFAELAGEHAASGEGPAPEPPGGWADFQALFGDPGQATKAALKVFTWAFGFPPAFDLEIDEA